MYIFIYIISHKYQSITNFDYKQNLTALNGNDKFIKLPAPLVNIIPVYQLQVLFKTILVFYLRLLLKG